MLKRSCLKSGCPSIWTAIFLKISLLQLRSSLNQEITWISSLFTCKTYFSRHEVHETRTSPLRTIHVTYCNFHVVKKNMLLLTKIRKCSLLSYSHFHLKSLVLFQKSQGYIPFFCTHLMARRRVHEQNISLTASCCCSKVKQVYKISINCDQISRHGNKDVKENTRMSPWNIYGFVLITNFILNSVLRGFIRTPVVDGLYCWQKKIIGESGYDNSPTSGSFSACLS